MKTGHASERIADNRKKKCFIYSTTRIACLFAALCRLFQKMSLPFYARKIKKSWKSLSSSWNGSNHGHKNASFCCSNSAYLFYPAPGHYSVGLLGGSDTHRFHHCSEFYVAESEKQLIDFSNVFSPEQSGRICSDRQILLWWEKNCKKFV